MDSQIDTLDDVSALAWVQDELRKSLDAAHKALRRTLKETESTFGSDLDDVEPAMLRSARQHIHQGVGVLELVGLPAGASLLRGSEALVQRFIAKPHKLDVQTVEAIEKASFALLDFLALRLAGKPVSPVALFPQYRAVQELAGAERVHPADLWPHDWQWQALPAEPGVPPRGADAAVTTEFESQALALMRKPLPAVTQRLSDLSAGLAAGAEHAHTATLWRLAAGFFEAQSKGLLEPDLYSKRTTSRLLAQLRSQQRDGSAAGERLAQDLTFFCSQAIQPADGQAPRLASVRRAYPATRDALPVDYHKAVLGRYDPAWITQARKRVATARDTWSAVAGGETHRLSGLGEQFALVADSLKRLVPGGEGLGDAMSRAAALAMQSNGPPPAELAMEVATSVLYLEAALEDGGFDQPVQSARMARLAQRIDAVRSGGQPEPLEPWMEELYRLISDRQTMGSVVQELRSALSESEKLIDQFFRAPAEPAVMIPVPGQLQAMRGVLSVLGLDQGVQAVLRMRDDVEALVVAGPEARHQQPLFERLAGNLSALSFLIDLLGVQPQAAKSLFRFDARSGLLESSMGRHSTALEQAAAPRLEPALIEQAQSLVTSASGAMPLDEVSREIERLSLEPEVAAQPDLAASLSSAQMMLLQADKVGPEAELSARSQVVEALAGFVSTASDPIGLDVLPASAPMPLMSLALPTPVGNTGLEEDDEMREIFLEEAREVLETARSATAALEDSPGDVEQMTAIRRAFHTLKGSSRMVGLGEFGEAAWAFEQLYNAQLATQRPADDDLLSVTDDALLHFEKWTAAIAAGQGANWRSPAARRVADALRIEGRRLTFIEDEAPAPLHVVANEMAPAPAAPPMAPLALVLPPASDLDLIAAPELEKPTPELPQPAAAAAFPGMDFTFDLGGSQDAEPLFETAATEPMPLPDAPDLGSVQEPPSFVVDHGFEIAPTEPVPLEELPASAALEEAQITSMQLDIPSEFSGDAALDEPWIIESLKPSAAVAEEFSEAIEAGTAAPEPDLSEPDGGVIEAAWSSESIASSSIVEPLQPSVPAALDSLSASTADLSEPVEPLDESSEQIKVVGPLRIGIPLFNIYLNEADELSRRLATELSEWALELHRPVGETAVALAHSLAGSSATVGFADLSALARQLEHVLEHSHALGRGRREDAELFIDVADEVRRLLHQFAAGFLKAPPQDLLDRLSATGIHIARQLEAQLSAPLDSTEEAFDEAHAGEEAVPPAHEQVADVPREVEALSEPGAEAPQSVVPESRAELSAPPQAPASMPAELYGVSVFGGLGQADFKPFVPLAVEPARPASMLALDSDEDIDAVDAVDADLFPFFEEEAQELLPELAGRLRDWARSPEQGSHAAASMRTLHTLKGGARLAGAMRLGELAHRLETAIEHLLQREPASRAEIEALLGRADALTASFDQLRQRDAQAYAAAQAAVVPLTDRPRSHVVTTSWPPLDEPAPVEDDVPLAPEGSRSQASDTLAAPQHDQDAELVPEVAADAAPTLPPAVPATVPGIDWSAFGAGEAVERSAMPAGARAPHASNAAVRVRTQLLDRMVNQAGEVSIARSRLESEVTQIKSSLGDLTDNLERLRGQLRDIELQAETQMSTRMEAAKAAAQAFDPLEFDRFTRFQELTRMMAESVNDVATVQRSLQRTLETAEDELAAQARLTRDLQDDLLRTRMVEFEGLSERLYRVVRQAAKETGKQVRLDILGGSIEVDRGVLDRMTGAFEHLLRNCVTHGIERPELRTAAGKDAAGQIVVALHQEGNEVSVEFRDDGAGLDLPRIRDKGVAMGLIDGSLSHGEAELANLIFTPGFSTADSVTELSGRGVGMDVVRSEVNALGGRIETATAPGQGTSFKLVLPLTTAVTQVVMLRSGDATIAVPATLVEVVRRASPAEIEEAYARGLYPLGDQALPFFWLGALLQLSPRGSSVGARMLPVVVVRSAAQRVVLHVDEVLGHQEVVVKNLGPQLSRLPGLAGMTLLASGAVSLIYNPVALATVYADAARAAMAEAPRTAITEVFPVAQAVRAAPLVLVVDDSLTVRRVTQRLLAREGYRVMLAKDGLDALERLAEELPAVVLSDIEMPRMDGFDLVRNLRADPKLADLPVIMITSRIAQKHREYAAQLGVNHYLGKPYSEEELLGLIGHYCAAQAPVA